ncbi:O-antigen ligase family protein [Enterocloster citroniae]
MIKANKNKVSIKTCLTVIAINMFLGSIIFGEFLQVNTNNLVIYGMYFLSIICIIIANMKNKVFIFSKKILQYGLPWIIFFIIFVFIYNVMIFRHNYYTTIRWTFCFLMIFLIGNLNCKYYEKIMDTFLVITYLYVISSAVMLVFPHLYKSMYLIWGYWPTGTNGGAAGYRAGIAAHYSENAMVITMTLLALFSRVLGSDEVKRGFWRQNKWYIAAIIAAGTMLLLTTKRAHILFGFTAILMTYYLRRPEKRTGRFFQVLLIGIFLTAAFYVSAINIPALREVLFRFLTIGSDQESTTRFLMWKLALKLFMSFPIFGIGWGGYKYQFHLSLYDPRVRADRYQYLNAHNVYLQLLSETGIVGFLLFMSGAIIIFYKTIVLLKHDEIKYNQGYRTTILFSIMVQIFIALYSVTGNCLYDIMFSFYALAVGLSFGIRLMIGTGIVK